MKCFSIKYDEIPRIIFIRVRRPAKVREEDRVDSEADMMLLMMRYDWLLPPVLLCRSR